MILLKGCLVFPSDAFVAEENRTQTQGRDGGKTWGRYLPNTEQRGLRKPAPGLLISDFPPPGCRE